MAGMPSAGLLAAALLLALPAFGQDGVVAEGEGCPDRPDADPLDDPPVLMPGWDAIEQEDGEPSAGRPWPRRPIPRLPPRPLPPDRTMTWTVDLDGVVGESYSVPFASALMTFRVGFPDHKGFGVVVPFSLGVQPDGSEFGCYGFGCGTGAAWEFGNAALFATWEPLRRPSTRLAVAMVVVFPTTFGSPNDNSLLYGGRAVTLVGPPRGFEDLELFFRRSVGAMPSFGVSHSAGLADFSATARTGLFVGDVGVGSPCLLFGGLGTVQVMVRVLDQRQARVSVGARALGAVWVLNEQEPYGDTPVDSRYGPLMYPASVSVEPRVEACLGGLELRTGFVIPIAYRETERTAVRFFPEAWGVRVGVGYSF